jgi:tetratricopeptide (TPR) repeat protein
MRHILDSVASADDILTTIEATLEAYSVYDPPIARSATRNEAIVFKAMVNHRFLRDVLKSHQEHVLTVYKRFEKVFEVDGLFWLQYGLALRSFNLQEDALEKLRTALEAYPMAHTEHAFAHQLLISAIRSSNEGRANAYLEDARERLMRLDSAIRSDDTYPIVTLAEGDTRVTHNFRGQSSAIAVAQNYLANLKNRYRGNLRVGRVAEAIENLEYFSATGTWRSTSANFDDL